MKIEDVRKLPPLERFLYWIKERHLIWCRRRQGKQRPWTDDEILRSYFFTNPYRENDKVTVWFRENVREPLRDDPRVLFATVAFRWFNLIETGYDLLGYPRVNDDLSQVTEDLKWKLEKGRAVPDYNNLLVNWNPNEVLERLGKVRDRGEKIFTGAFMINSPGGERKLEAIVRRITNVWNDREELETLYAPGFEANDGEPPSMQAVHDTLTTYDGMGGFMAYEVVCDLRYTYLLENAPDKLTWCNVGPGARRGLYRILGVPFDKGNNAAGLPQLPNEMDEMRKLLEIVQKRLPLMPRFEMREIEHALCEADKYNRALEQDGKLKRTYNDL